MARPRKKHHVKLTHRLPHMRCTETEFLDFKERADQCGLSMSAFGRQMMLNGKVVVNDNPDPVDPALMFQLQAIGNNLNQIARIANMTGDVREDLERVLKKITELADRMIEKLGN